MRGSGVFFALILFCCRLNFVSDDLTFFLIEFAKIHFPSTVKFDCFFHLQKVGDWHFIVSNHVYSNIAKVRRFAAFLPSSK